MGQFIFIYLFCGQGNPLPCFLPSVLALQLDLVTDILIQLVNYNVHNYKGLRLWASEIDTTVVFSFVTTYVVFQWCLLFKICWFSSWKMYFSFWIAIEITLKGLVGQLKYKYYVPFVDFLQVLFLVDTKLDVAFSQHMFVTQPIQVTNTVYYSVSVCINDWYIYYIYI